MEQNVEDERPCRHPTAYFTIDGSCDVKVVSTAELYIIIICTSNSIMSWPTKHIKGAVI